MAQTVRKSPTVQETWLQSLGWEGALEKEMVTHASVLTWTEVRLSSVSDDRGETLPSHGQRSLEVYSAWGRKESDTTERLTHFCLIKLFFAQIKLITDWPKPLTIIYFLLKEM